MEGQRFKRRRRLLLDNGEDADDEANRPIPLVVAGQSSARTALKLSNRRIASYPRQDSHVTMHKDRWSDLPIRQDNSNISTSDKPNSDFTSSNMKTAPIPLSQTSHLAPMEKHRRLKEDLNPFLDLQSDTMNMTGYHHRLGKRNRGSWEDDREESACGLGDATVSKTFTDESTVTTTHTDRSVIHHSPTSSTFACLPKEPQCKFDSPPYYSPHQVDMNTNHTYKATRRKLSTEVRRPGLGAILQKYGTSHNKFGRSRSATTPTISDKTQGSVTRYQSTSNPLSMPSGRENGFPNSPLNTNIASPFSSSADAAATSFRLHPRQSMPTARSIMNVHRAQSTEVAVARRGLLASPEITTGQRYVATPYRSDSIRSEASASQNSFATPLSRQSSAQTRAPAPAGLRRSRTNSMVEVPGLSRTISQINQLHCTGSIPVRGIAANRNVLGSLPAYVVTDNQSRTEPRTFVRSSSQTLVDSDETAFASTDPVQTEADELAADLRNMGIGQNVPESPGLMQTSTGGLASTSAKSPTSPLQDIPMPSSYEEAQSRPLSPVSPSARYSERRQTVAERTKNRRQLRPRLSRSTITIHKKRIFKKTSLPRQHEEDSGRITRSALQKRTATRGPISSFPEAVRASRAAEHSEKMDMS